jgi:hypothetical protein
MDEIRQVELAIIWHCEAPEGFLVQVQSRAVFNEKQHQELVATLEKYDEMLGDSEMISRHVAYSLFSLNNGLADAIAKYGELGLPAKSKVAAAHAEIWLLIDRLLTPPQLRGKLI